MRYDELKKYLNINSAWFILVYMAKKEKKIYSLSRFSRDNFLIAYISAFVTEAAVVW